MEQNKAKMEETNMNTAKVVELPKPKKVIRPKIEQVVATHVVDVWRLVDASLRHGEQLYPDTTEDSRELIQMHLFNYMQQPNFLGLMAKIGKRPVGVVMGHAASRPYGRPSRYAFVWCLWVDPHFRKHGTGQILWQSYADLLKKANIFHWEAHSTEHLEKSLVRETGIPVKKLMSVIGGRL